MTATVTERDPSLSRGYANGRARRDLIIRIASEHFAVKGFLSATILDIAASVGISRAGLLHHFPDKEALLEAVLEARDDEDRRRFEPYQQAGGALGVLRGMVDLADHNRLTPGLIELFVRLSAEASVPNHPAHDYFAERYRRIRSGTEQALKSAQRAGHVRSDVDAAATSVRLTALMDGLQAQWLLDRAIDMAAHVGQAIAELLTDTGTQLFHKIPDRFALIDGGEGDTVNPLKERET